MKTALADKTKVSLAPTDGNSLWQIFEDGQCLSSGLNVLVGARSSGKTFLLQKIDERQLNVKYIKQFQLVQQDDPQYFNGQLENSKGIFASRYLEAFKGVVEQVIDINIGANERLVEKYVETLRKSAEESGLQDAFSQAALFNEVEFSVGDTKNLEDLIKAVQKVIENGEYGAIVSTYVDTTALQRLAVALIDLLRAKAMDIQSKIIVNGLVKDIKSNLKLHTAATQLEDVDLYSICLDARKVQRFEQIVQTLKIASTIHDEAIQGFRVESRKQPYSRAQEVKDVSRRKTSFVDAYARYASPYEYLRLLAANDALSRGELYKLFVKINYRILNKDGYEVSGGERSEFRLLQEISEAQNYDLLLIDEPESSFDNIFLKSDVNQLLKSIAKNMPVLIVTHNNTLGASIGADYLLYTRKDGGEDIVYRLFSGHPTDKFLICADGSSVPTFEVLMDSLEAGSDAYQLRGKGYENLKH